MLLLLLLLLRRPTLILILATLSLVLAQPALARPRISTRKASTDGKTAPPHHQATHDGDEERESEKDWREAAGGVFSYVQQNEPACFLEEVTVGSTMVATYAHPEALAKPLELVVRAPDGKEARQVARKGGRFAFAATMSGEHKLCVQAVVSTPPRPWPAASRSAKFYLRLETISNDDSSAALATGADVAKQSHVKNLEQKLVTLARDVDALLRDVRLAKERETHFRDQSERINASVVHWSIFQTLVLVLTGVFQSLYLQRYFRRKKIA